MSRTRLALAGGAVLLAIQLVPVSRTNPPVTATVAAPPEVLGLLRRACFDCHSHETVWAAPQAYVAPASWLVAHDVKEARKHLDFSAWDRVDQRKVAKALPGEVGEGDMPPWYYLIAHPGARLSDAERATLAAWARGLGPAGAAP
jgi:hypothetical protein